MSAADTAPLCSTPVIHLSRLSEPLPGHTDVRCGATLQQLYTVHTHSLTLWSPSFTATERG